MSDATLRLSVTSRSGASHARPFLDDICLMLAAVATREGVSVTFGATEPGGRAALVPDAPVLCSALRSQLGVHRAQLLPPSERHGRIVTVVVLVSLARGGDPASQGDPAFPIRTYNYPLGSVIVHATGERLALGDVLTGRAG